MSSSFHAQRLGLVKHTYGCGCGCNSCGDASYSGSEYGSKYWAPGGMPNWNYDMWGRNKYLAGGCPDYDKAVKDFKKASAEYDALPRGLFGVKSSHDAKKEKIIQRAKKAQSEGKSAKRACETAIKVGEGKYDADTAAMQAGRQMIDTAAAAADPAAAAAPAAPVTTVSTDTTQQSGGGSNTMLFLGIGAVVLVGGGLFLFKKGKKKKKKAVTAAPVPAA